LEKLAMLDFNLLHALFGLEWGDMLLERV
jgi:hypothetical protein